ncbi:MULTISPECIES: hypothetical protein [unclassified Streptomyces]|uniref:hypothetical protein n=1 Tax=unclassified Streptomyces TaxID=2593676 RepID=UPI0033B77A93
MARARGDLTALLTEADPAPASPPSGPPGPAGSRRPGPYTREETRTGDDNGLTAER